MTLGKSGSARRHRIRMEIHGITEIAPLHWGQVDRPGDNVKSNRKWQRQANEKTM